MNSGSIRPGRERERIEESETIPAGRLDVFERLSWIIVAATTVFLPLLISPAGKEVFRLPKNLFLLAGAITLSTLAVSRALLRPQAEAQARWPRFVLAFMAAAIAWTSVTTILSTNISLSIRAFLMLMSAAALFTAAYGGLQNRSLSVVYLAFIPAVTNAVLAIGQYFRWISWPKVVSAPTPRMRAIGLLGNPDDVGMFLVPPLIAAGAVAITSKKTRALTVPIVILLSLGVLASESLTGIGATLAGMFVLGMGARPRLTAALTLAVILSGTAFVRLTPARWAVAQHHMNAMAGGDFDTILAGRVPAFQAAWQMFLRDPITGVGPGCFSLHYFELRVAMVAATAPISHNEALTWSLNRVEVNFGETHSEYLQTLAEGGLPMFMIFLAGLAVVASPSFRLPAGLRDDRMEFARRLALPLACSIAILALTAFPMRVAAPTANALFLIAAVLAWGENARA
jgi:O-antigen ligase